MNIVRARQLGRLAAALVCLCHPHQKTSRLTTTVDREVTSPARLENRGCPYNYTIEVLQETAYRLSREIIEMTTRAGSGHPSSSLSAIDIMTGLYSGGIMSSKPQEPDWPDRDRFILSILAPHVASPTEIEPFLTVPNRSSNVGRRLATPLWGTPSMQRQPGAVDALAPETRPKR